MTLEDANRISMVIGSVDSLDSDTRHPTAESGAADSAAAEVSVTTDQSDSTCGQGINFCLSH